MKGFLHTEITQIRNLASDQLFGCAFFHCYHAHLTERLNTSKFVHMKSDFHMTDFWLEKFMVIRLGIKRPVQL